MPFQGQERPAPWFSYSRDWLRLLTMMINLRTAALARPLKSDFLFAGFRWPRYVAQIACGPAALRKKWAGRTFCGEYYHAPKPEQAGVGRGFFLGGAGQPFTRWQWCDDVAGVSIDHCGWFCSVESVDKIRGIVVALPHGRFMAGWSLGLHMASGVGPPLYDTAREAAYAADAVAKDVADREWTRKERLGDGHSC